MAGWTNKGKAQCLNLWANIGFVAPTAFYIALVKSTPTADTDTFTTLTEIAVGNGYVAGGQALTRNSTNFDITEDDGTDQGDLTTDLDITWTNSGGTIPSDGIGATYVCVLDDDATPANREVFHFGSFGGAKVSGTDQDFVVQNLTISLTE